MKVIRSEVKLVHTEPESEALRGWLDDRAETGWISSVLTEVESFRVLARYAPEAPSLWGPRTSSTSRDQVILVDQTTDASLPSDAVLLKIDRFG